MQSAYAACLSSIVKRRTLLRGLVGLAILIGASLPTIAAPPATRPSAPSTRSVPTTRPAPRDLKKLAHLTRSAIQLLEQSKLDEAERVLRQALSLDPRYTINLYNFACLRAVQGRHDEAIDYLERAAEAGFTDFTHIAADRDLDALRDLPRYRQFFSRKGFFQRKAADEAVAELKERFGDGYLYEIDERAKLIFATNVDATTLAALKGWLTAQAASQWKLLFEHKPDNFITVVVPSAADFRKIVRTPGVGGFYNDEARILIAQRLGQVMTHEFTHALHAADRAPLGQDHPIWIAEGLASMYEAATFDGDNLVPADNFRLGLLQNASRGKKLIPLEKLLRMTQKEFVGRAHIAYGQAGSLMLYLYEKKLVRPFYDAYKADFEKDPTGQSALEWVTGKTLAEVEKDWTKWMLSRKAPAANTGPAGAFLGAQLEEISDGLKVGSVLPKGAADTAGLRAGDVLVGIGGREVRDFGGFYPLLSTYRPGERVVLRIRRDGKYLDLPIKLGNRAAPIGPLAPTTRPAK
jgi:tetratricopeptide (TPR) repeat protein